VTLWTELHPRTQQLKLHHQPGFGFGSELIECTSPNSSTFPERIEGLLVVYVYLFIWVWCLRCKLCWVYCPTPQDPNSAIRNDLVTQHGLDKKALSHWFKSEKECISKFKCLIYVRCCSSRRSGLLSTILGDPGAASWGDGIFKWKSRRPNWLPLGLRGWLSTSLSGKRFRSVEAFFALHLLRSPQLSHRQKVKNANASNRRKNLRKHPN